MKATSICGIAMKTSYAALLLVAVGGCGGTHNGQPVGHFVCATDGSGEAAIFLVIEKHSKQPLMIGFDRDHTGAVEMACVVSAGSLSCETWCDEDENRSVDAMYKGVSKKIAADRMFMPTELEKFSLGANFKISAAGLPDFHDVRNRKPSEYHIARASLCAKDGDASLWLVFERQKNPELVGRFVCLLVDDDGDSEADFVVGFDGSGQCVTYMFSDQSPWEPVESGPWRKAQADDLAWLRTFANAVAESK